jgi:predicted RecA/RadA family phage recombinase
MALSADTPRVYELGDINEVPVKASSTIYEGSAVGMTSGYARALNAGDDFAGFAQRKADNSAVATDGAINCKVISKGLIKATLSGVAVTDIGSPVYMSDDGTFTLTQGSNSYVGVVYRYVTTDTCIVAFKAHGTNDAPIAAGASLNSAQILVGNSSNLATARAVTGDITINNSGAVAIGSGKVLSAMISSSQVAFTHFALSTLSSIASMCGSAITSHTSSSAH